MKKKRKNNINKQSALIIGIFTILLIILIQYLTPKVQDYIDKFNNKYINAKQETISYSIEEIPEYSGNPYIVINNNIPYFKEEDYTTESFERYSDLDNLGRCGVAYANVCKDIMPKKGKKRGDISSIHPTGWKQKKYNGEYLYNRCHLIGYQLSDDDANERNLITGTRYFNVSGMLQFENQVAEYIRNQNEDKHVLYRVTPIFEKENMLASGVQMEAYSIEDSGIGICFNVYVYNVQPGVDINYKTGESKLR